VNLKQIFMRRTSGGRFIPPIDGLRFIAITSVLMLHLLGQMQTGKRYGPGIANDQSLFQQIVSHGHVGVQLFFVISGFILGLPFASHYLRGDKKPKLKNFYIRRLTRLEPPYILTNLLLFLVFPFIAGVGYSKMLPHLLASLTYTNNLIYHQLPRLNNVQWSLEVEVQFYMLAPFLATVFAIKDRLKRRGVILGLALAGTFLPYLLGIDNHTWWLRLTLLGSIEYFAMGFLAADVFVSEFDSRTGNDRRWDLVALLAVAATLVVMPTRSISLMVLPFSFVALVLAALAGNWTRRLLSLSFVTSVGGMCYSIYLLHFNVIAIVSRATMKVKLPGGLLPNFALQLALCGAAVLAVASIFFLLIEKPCMNPNWPRDLANRLFPNRRQPLSDHGIVTVTTDEKAATESA
jgi:peptidoglycan/LPS O-acetylase OafA/YrhL